MGPIIISHIDIPVAIVMAVFATANLLIVCATCVVIVAVTRNSASLRDFAKVLRARRRWPLWLPATAADAARSVPLDREEPDPARVSRAQDEVNDR